MSKVKLLVNGMSKVKLLVNGMSKVKLLVNGMSKVKLLVNGMSKVKLLVNGMSKVCSWLEDIFVVGSRHLKWKVLGLKSTVTVVFLCKTCILILVYGSVLI